MFQLLINGEAVDLSPDSSISIEEESPVFDQDTIPGGFSFPFELPTTPKNNRIFSHPGRIQAKTQGGLDIPFQLFNNGKYIGSGTATVQKATDRSYRTYLQVASGDFAGKISGKKLSEVDFGGTRTWEFIPDYVYPESDFALFPVYNPDFMDGTEYQAAWLANKNRLNSHESGDWYDMENTVMSISPYPYLAYVVSRVFYHFGFQIDENILASDPDFRKLVIYNNRDASNFTTIITTTTKTIYDTRTGSWAPHQQTVKVSTLTQDLGDWNLKDFLPDILISDFILAIRNLLNLAFIVTSHESIRIMKRQDLVAFGSPVSLANKYIGRPLVAVSPSISGLYLRWTHEENDKLFSEGFKNIYEDESLLRPPVQTMDELEALTPTVNEIRLIVSYGQYYQYSTEEVDGVTTYSWKFFSNDFQDLKIGSNLEEFTTKASTLPMIHYQREIGGPFIRCPHAEQLSSSVIRSTSLPCSLRLLLYQGMVEDSLGTLYPYGSSDAFGPGGSLLSGSSLSLRWDSATGLYEQLWKGYLAWWNTRKTVTWTIVDPSLLDFTTIYEIEKNHYILKKKTLTITGQGPEPGDCEFYRI